MKGSPLRITFIILSAVVALVLASFAGIEVSRLDKEIRQRFDGKRWSLPAIVYARALELYPGLRLTPEMLEEELQLAGYRKEASASGAGSYARAGATISLVSRDFYFPSGFEPSRHLTVTFAKGQVATLTSAADSFPVPLARLDPAGIGSFHPLVHEDRLLLNRAEIPELLVKTLLAMEDRNFYEHHGIAPLAILRALFANIRAGKTVQGGSTLTQQLVKNLFLSSERTLLRKVQEAVMAILLEYHYEKDEILTAYINEVFLGQDNNRAVHGFALASQFYFRRGVEDLRADQIAILVGMIKGPSYYDPRRHPDHCLERRNLVLTVMAAHGLLADSELAEALARPLTEVAVHKSGFNRYFAFLDLVRQQLAGEYREEDLQANGLQIFTTLDPQIQQQVEKNLQRTIAALQAPRKEQELQGAVLVTNRANGEVLALAGGKNPLEDGFNRALKARRPIGSLVKPAVYLAALRKGLTLASPLQDTALTLASDNGSPWRPENYDHKEHGLVPLFSALAHSYNLATVHLGLAVGLEAVVAAIGDLGYPQDIQTLPSLLLGAIEMSPFEVGQMYQTIASGGFYTSLRAIGSVMAADHTILTRYGLAVEQRVDPATTFLLTHALQRVVSEGTGASLLRSTLKDHGVAGKTGTSDGLRDSWFAGFTGDHLTVAWLGRDDNQSSFLSGSTGALKVWENIMINVPSAPLQVVEPDGIVWTAIDRTTLQPGDAGNSTLLPFLAGTEPDAPRSPASVPVPSPAAPVPTPAKGSKGLLETIGGWFK